MLLCPSCSSPLVCIACGFAHQSLRNQYRRAAIHLSRDVGIDGGGNADIGMPHALTEHFEGDTQLQPHRDVEMPQVMLTGVGQPGASGDGAEAAVEHGEGEGEDECCWEHWCPLCGMSPNEARAFAEDRFG
jgi:hypothetical protein